MRHAVLLSIAAMSAVLTGCGGSVDDQSAGQRGGVGPCADCNPPEPEPDPKPTPNPTPTPDPKPDADAGTGPVVIIQRFGDVVDDGVLDPNDWFITIGTPAPICGDADAAWHCGKWRAKIGIPEALLGPGVLDLADPRLLSFHSFMGPDRGGGDCYAGGGSFIEGTIEIVSVAPDSVEFRLAGTSTWEFDANGSHTAEVCER